MVLWMDKEYLPFASYFENGCCGYAWRRIFKKEKKKETIIETNEIMKYIYIYIRMEETFNFVTAEGIVPWGLCFIYIYQI